MKAQNLNSSWTLMNGEPSNLPMMEAYQQKQEVSLPHDAMISQNTAPNSGNGSSGGYYPGSLVTYRKTLTLTEEDLAGKVMLQFDGCYGKTRVRVNGNQIARHTYGYTPFVVDLTEKARPGDNVIDVVASTQPEKMGRWYTGTGLYRGVQLLTSAKAHIAPEGVYIYMKEAAGDDAVAALEVTVANESETDLYADVVTALTLRKMPAEGARSEADPDAAPSACGKARVFIPAHTTRMVRDTINVKDAALWSPEEPNLYDVDVKLVALSSRADAGTEGGQQQTEVLDAAHTVTGLRTIAVDAVHGLRINGKEYKLKGGCIHHDNGILGAAAFADAEYRKALRHKQNGFNALRFAHNPVSAEMLAACDELGIITIDEAYDIWNVSKTTNDYANEFDAEDGGVTELAGVLLRDRNHPSVIFWSIGNELPEQGGLADGYETSRRLAETVRSYDRSRPVMGALCSFFNGLDRDDNARFWQSMMEDMDAKKNAAGGFSNIDSKYGRNVWLDYTAPFVTDWDVVGYNYLSYQFDPSHERFPDRVMATTESKPAEMVAYWNEALDRPYVLGDFVWTSQDYIGEAAIGRNFYIDDMAEFEKVSRAMHNAEYPCRLAGGGEFDLCGFETPRLAFRRILWGSKETHIAVRDPKTLGKIELLGRYGWPAVEHSWNWDVEAGTKMEVHVYTSADEVELFVNGASVGRKAVCHARSEREALEQGANCKPNEAVFTVPFAKGTLEAVSFTKGQEVSRDALCSGTGVPAALRLEVETDLPSDELIFVRAEVVDEEGILVPMAEVKLSAQAEGGELIAFGTGRPVTDENYTAGEITTFKGAALAVIRKAGDGEVELEVSADGFEADASL